MDFSDRHEMVEIGSFKVKRNVYRIWIFSGFKFPHFAIGDNLYGTTLRIDKPKYWYTTWRDITPPFALTPNINRALNDFLNARSTVNSSLTNWQYIIDTWNRLNPDYKVKATAKIPDYSKAMLDINRIQSWTANNQKSAEEQAEAYAKTLPKYEYAAFNSRGDCDSMYLTMNSYADKGYRFVGAVQGHDCPLAVVFMERPRLEISTPDEPDEEIF